MMRKLAVTVFAALSFAALGCGSDNGNKSPDAYVAPAEAGAKLDVSKDQAMGPETQAPGPEAGQAEEAGAGVDTAKVVDGAGSVDQAPQVDQGSAVDGPKTTVDGAKTVDGGLPDATPTVDGGGALDASASEAGSVG